MRSVPNYVPLGSKCQIIAGQSPRGRAYNNRGEGLPFFQGKKEFTEKYLGSATTWTTEVTKVAEPGDILISVRAPVGPINIATEKVCIGRGLAAIRPGVEIVRDFLWYALLWLQPKIKRSEGAVFPSISRTQIAALQIPLPPLDEQKRIVAILDEAFEGLDRAKANAEANLKFVRVLGKSFVKEAFGSPAWPIVRLPDVCENLDSRRVPVTKKDRTKGSIPYYGASGVVDFVADYLFDENLLLVSEDGANLLARTYPIAFSISGKAWVNNHAHVLKFNDLVDQKFVEIYLNSISLEGYVSGMAQPKLNQKALNRIPIPFPDQQTRSEFVEKAGRVDTEMCRLTAVYTTRLTEISDLRQSLLHRAFSGELT